MKRVVLLLLSILICLSCTACRVTELPDHSDNFDREFIESFFENYSLADPQLSYFSASPWEAEFGDGNTQYLLSLIDDADPSEFVSVTEYFFFIGAPYVTFGVYQSADAPTPMKDWTIESITLLSGYLPFTPTDANEVSEEDFARKPMEYNLSVSEEIKVFSRKEFRDFLNSIADSYETPNPSQGRNFKSVYKYEEDGLPGKSWEEYTYYYLLVRFEENSNIVWLTELYHEDGELYFTHGANQYEYCALGSDLSQTICELIGFESPTGSPDSSAESTQ